MSLTIKLRSITPRTAKLLDVDALDKALRETINKTVKPDVLEMFAVTVDSWSIRPRFRAVTKINKTGISLEVYPSGTRADIWSMLNQGTRGHRVEPKNKKALRFRSRYKAKTAPGLVGSGPGGGSGKFVFSKGHWVKGIKARRWDKAIAKEAKKGMKSKFDAAIKAATKKRRR